MALFIYFVMLGVLISQQICKVILNPGVPLFPIEALFCYKPSGILLASDSLIYGNEKSYRQVLSCILLFIFCLKAFFDLKFV